MNNDKINVSKNSIPIKCCLHPLLYTYMSFPKQLKGAIYFNFKNFK